MTAEWLTGVSRNRRRQRSCENDTAIYPTRFGQIHLRSNEVRVRACPWCCCTMSPRSSAMWEMLQERLERPSHAPDRLG